MWQAALTETSAWVRTDHVQALPVWSDVFVMHSRLWSGVLRPVGDSGVSTACECGGGCYLRLLRLSLRPTPSPRADGELGDHP